MKRSVIIISSILVLVVTVLFVMAITQKPASMFKDPLIGEPGEMAEDFELVNLSGESVSLEQLNGERVYVKFWASWCSICLAGMEDLNALSAEATDFKVLTIVTPGYNGEMEKDDFITWFDGLGYDNIEVLLDEEGTITKAYGVRAYPTSAYISSEGELIKILPGHTENSMIIDTFENMD